MQFINGVSQKKMCVYRSFFRGHLFRGFALFFGSILVPVWGGPSGVYMFARVRYVWVHAKKKSLVIFVVIVLVVVVVVVELVVEFYLDMLFVSMN